MPYRSHFNPNQPRVPQGHSDGGQWTRGGQGLFQPPLFQPPKNPLQDPLKFLEAALALYTSLSRYNGRDKQAVLIAKAREWRREEPHSFVYEKAELLSRE